MKRVDEMETSTVKKSQDSLCLGKQETNSGP